MLTLGIDLAAQPKNTAVCVIEWSGKSAKIKPVDLKVDDPSILKLAKACDVIGIDSPFGWPVQFIEYLVNAHPQAFAAVKIAPEYVVPGLPLNARLTDQAVKASIPGINPMLAATDKLGVVAMRCQKLLNALGVTDKGGDGHVFEVYPAAALAKWGLPFKGLKGPIRAGDDGPFPLAEALALLTKNCKKLAIPDNEKALALCANNHHAFDALVASLVARAAGLGLTSMPADRDKAIASCEGWIAIPDAGALAKL